MRAQCSVFIATSLDGFISRPDGSIDWLEAANASVPPGEDCGYAAFMSSIDTLVMGRETFDLVRTFDTWPYGDKRVHVMSRGVVQIPEARRERVTTSAEPPELLVRRLSDAGAKHLYIDGGLTIQSFFAAGLIDDITITTIPILLGAGRPLFGPLSADVRLVHTSTKAYDFGFVQNRYRVAR